MLQLTEIERKMREMQKNFDELTRSKLFSVTDEQQVGRNMMEAAVIDARMDKRLADLPFNTLPPVLAGEFSFEQGLRSWQ